MYEQTQQDLKDFHTQMGNFWKRLPDEVWDQKTGARDKDWTMHEVLAHILSIAQVFNKAATAAIKNEDLAIRDFSARDQFSDWNLSEIERLTKVAPNGLIVQLLQELRIAHDTVVKLTPETADNSSQVMQFSRSAPAIEYLQSQMSHAGVIHGAQVVSVLDREPLWVDFSDDFTHRVIGHYLNQWSLSYWVDEGPQEQQILNFHINGDGGGEWHLVMNPTASALNTGVVDGAEYDLFFDHPQTFFGVFSNYLSLRQAMVAGKLRMASDVRDTLNVLKLFGPKRPV